MPKNTIPLPSLEDDAAALRAYRARGNTSWKSQGLCEDVENFEIFFPSRGEAVEETIRTYCAQCPVRIDCLAVSMEKSATPGIWGGRSQKQRRDLAKLLEESEPAPVPEARPTHPTRKPSIKAEVTTATGRAVQLDLFDIFSS